MNTRALRDALGQFATGVCLISVNDAHSGPLALTANSFASVSLEPPLVLWSIQNSAECFREYTDCEYFGISVLAQAQQALSNRYARRGEHGIDAPDFEIDPDHVPLLKHATAHFTCRTHTVYPGGDHHIVVGEVVRFQSDPDSPLLFHSGQYGALAGVGVAAGTEVEEGA